MVSMVTGDKFGLSMVSMVTDDKFCLSMVSMVTGESISMVSMVTGYEFCMSVVSMVIQVISSICLWFLWLQVISLYVYGFYGYR